jgi:hypothetical protein
MDAVEEAMSEAIRDALEAPIAQRGDVVSAIAVGLCRSHLRRDPDLPCLCDRAGRRCHADTIYRNEAISVLLALEARGFEIRRDGR